MAAVSTLLAEELPFLAEICAAPEDDAPRLVFADWLEERGDIRGEMLRVGCALARLELDDPQYDALAAREAELCEPCRTEWLARLPKIEGVEYGLEHLEKEWRRSEDTTCFTRGMLEDVTLASPASLKSCRALFDAYGIRRVQLEDPLAASPDSPTWKRVTTLQLTGGTRQWLPLLGSWCLSALRKLCCLHERAFEGDAYDMLRTLSANPASSELRSLYVARGVSDDVLAALQEWAHAPLTEIALDGFGENCSPAGVTKWLVSPAASRLERLELSGIDFGSLAHITLGSANLRTLRRLFLTNAGLQRATPEALATLTGLPKVEWLALDNNQLGDGAVAALAPSLHSGLRRLDLEENRLGPKAAAALSTADLTGLRRLRLSHNRLDDEAAIALARCPQLAGLVDLDLFENQIGDKGALALAESPHLTHLKRLDLFNNPIRRTYTRETLAERFGAGVSLSPPR